MAEQDEQRQPLDDDVEQWLKQMEQQVGPDRTRLPEPPASSARAGRGLPVPRPGSVSQLVPPPGAPQPDRRNVTPAPGNGFGLVAGQRMNLTRLLVLVNVVIFLFSGMLSGNLLQPTLDILVLLGAKENSLIIQGEYWRLLSACFLHGSLLHLAFNSFALWSIGQDVEALYGTPRFVALYLLAGLSGSLASFIFTNAVSVGASGAIFGLIGALVVFYYSGRSVFGQLSQMQLGNLFFLVAINLGLGFASPQIDNAAHLGGLVGGLVAGLALVPRFVRAARPGYLPSTTRIDRSEQVWLRTLVLAVLLLAFTLFVIGNA